MTQDMVCHSSTDLGQALGANGSTLPMDDVLDKDTILQVLLITGSDQNL